MNHNWDFLEQVFINGDMPLRQLSSEYPEGLFYKGKRPSYNRLHVVSQERNWKEKREQASPTIAVIDASQSASQLVAQLGNQSDTPSEPAQLHGYIPLHPSPRYIDSLPPELQEQYNAAFSDPDLFSLHPDLCVTHALLHRKSTQLTGFSSSKGWQALREKHAQLESAKAGGDNRKAGSLLYEIFQLIQEGARESDREEEIIKLQQHRLKLVESESKRVERREKYIREAAQLGDRLMDKFIQIVRENIGDSAAIASIERQFAGALESVFSD